MANHLYGEKDDNKMNMTDEVRKCEEAGYGHVMQCDLVGYSEEQQITQRLCNSRS